MNDNHKELITIALSLSIIAMAIFIVQRFIPSMLWAAIIAIATYPLYLRWQILFGSKSTLAALLFTLILSLLLLLPLSYLVSILFKELQIFINYLQLIDREGAKAPDFIQRLPLIGQDMVAYWDSNLGQPGNVKNFLANLHQSLPSTSSYYIREIGANLAHRGFQLSFTIMTLFFFYRDGHNLLEQINHIGEYCLGKRWFHYANRLPWALRATVNGTVLVGLGVGILMGLCYFFVGFPAPTLTGFFTAFAAMIPFVAPLVFIVVALILFSQGAIASTLIVLIWGSIVLFIADHLIKPGMIGGAIKLPFLAVLFGILGGVETLGLLGLFVGPIIMVLFVTLWQEPQEKNGELEIIELNPN